MPHSCAFYLPTTATTMTTTHSNRFSYSCLGSDRMRPAPSIVTADRVVYVDRSNVIRAVAFVGETIPADLGQAHTVPASLVAAHRIEPGAVAPAGYGYVPPGIAGGSI